jgi:hypothetical protein
MTSIIERIGDDVYAVVELPSNEAATALALSINRSAATKIGTAVLLTPEQVEAAASRCPTTSRRGAEVRRVVAEPARRVMHPTTASP